MMWQLLHTVKWLHSLHVWHRDLKTQNVFLVWENAERVIKVRAAHRARAPCVQRLLHNHGGWGGLQGLCSLPNPRPRLACPQPSSPISMRLCTDWRLWVGALSHPAGLPDR